MENLTKVGFKAVNIYFSAVCNLNCRYCFQPKIHEIGKSVNDKIIEWISSGKMEDDILKYYGPEIESICLWGGEPSINLPYLEKRLLSIFDGFPKLTEIQYSTNISTRKLADNTISFINKVTSLNREKSRKVIIDLQFSIDGPSELNDYNRIGSRADDIMENITHVLKNISSESRVHTHMKGTQSSDNLKWLSQGNNLLKYYIYFDEWESEWERLFDKRIVPVHGSFITLVYPGNYTQQDGFIFKEITEKQNSPEFQKGYAWKSSALVFDNQITSRIKDSFRQLRRGYYRDYKGELLSHCSCSAGRSCAGLTYDSKFHLCHGTYMFSEDVLKFIEDHNLVSEFEEKQGFSFRSYKNTVDGNIVASFDDDLRVSRILYRMNEFNNNLIPRIQYLEIMISSLAAAGQISNCYNKKKWRDLAISFLLFGGNSCPVDSIWEFGSPYIRSTSQAKLVFNGMFEYYMSTFYRDVLDIFSEKEND